MKRLRRQVKSFLRKHSDDVLIGGGWLMIVTGTSLLNLAIGLIVGGVLLVGIAVMVELGGANDRS